MTHFARILEAIARHAVAVPPTAAPRTADAAAPAPVSPTASPLEPVAGASPARAAGLPFPTDRGPAATASTALAAALAAAPGSVSGGMSGGMSGGVTGAIASPRAAALPDPGRVLDDLAAAHPGAPLDWRRSIADLLTLLGLDAGAPARAALAEELGYAGPPDDIAAMDAWLRGRVLHRLGLAGRAELARAS